MKTAIAANTIRGYSNVLNAYSNEKSRFKSLQLTKTKTATGRDIYVVSLQKGFFRYLRNQITWFFRANDFQKTMQGFKSLSHYQSIEHIVNKGQLPFIKRIAPYQKYDDNIDSAALGEDPNTPDKFPQSINVAVYGNGSSGKGSLIGKLMDACHTPQTERPTKDRQSKQEITQRFPLIKNIVLSELPAWGIQHLDTDNAQATSEVNTYKAQTKILDYDAIVITFCETFNLDDSLIEIINSARKNSIPCHFVRTKMDKDVENLIYNQPQQMEAPLGDQLEENTSQIKEIIENPSEDYKKIMAENRERIESDFINTLQLNSLNRNDRLYRISNWNEPYLSDFSDLKKVIMTTEKVNQLPPTDPAQGDS